MYTSFSHHTKLVLVAIANEELFQSGSMRRARNKHLVASFQNTKTRPLPPEVSEKICNCILELVKATPKTKFLEPGIGTGRIGFPIIDRGYDYTGIDINKIRL